MSAWSEPQPGEYWSLVPCRHWSKAKNRRYQIARIDGPIDYAGSWPCSVYDGDLKTWHPQWGGLKGHWLKERSMFSEFCEKAGI